MNSAAIFADGDVSLVGISAAGYLASLAEQYPDINTKYQKFKSIQQAVKDFLKSRVYIDDDSVYWDYDTILNKFGGINAVHYDNYMDYDYSSWASAEWCHDYPIECTCQHHADVFAALSLHFVSECLGSYIENAPGSWGFENPIASGKNSCIPYEASTSAIIPGLIESIKNSLGNQLENDISAQRVLQGLYELCWINRHYSEPLSHVTLTMEDKQCLDFLKNKILTPDSVPYGPIAEVLNEDDNPELTADNSIYEHRLISASEYMKVAKDIYLNNDPLSASWCSDNYFQGIVYSNGNVNASNKMKIYGTIVSHKNVNLKDASVIYCQEYMKLTGKTCPLELVLYREY
jgi:hypothetical protein